MTSETWAIVGLWALPLLSYGNRGETDEKAKANRFAGGRAGNT